MNNKILLFFYIISITLCSISAKAQPVFIKDIPTNSAFFSSANGNLFFFSGTNLWRSDGTAAGTMFIKDTGENPLYYGEATFAKTFLFVTYNADQTKQTLWRSDGSVIGTVKIATYNSIQPLIEYNGNFYFAIDDGITGQEIWKMTSSFSLSLLKNINPGAGDAVHIITDNPVVSNGFLFFSASDNGKDYDLWKTDGSISGTVKAVELNGSSILNLTDVNGLIYFSLLFTQVSLGYEYHLYKSNGTASGTILVDKFVVPDGVNTVLQHFFSYKQKLYFIIDWDIDIELWTSDGTSQGTKIIYTFPGNGDIWSADIINGQMYFVSDEQGGFRITTSDGTSEGTKILFHPSTPYFTSAKAENLLFFNNGPSLIGAPNNAPDADQLFQSDLTKENTKAVRNIFPGTNFKNTYHITGVKEKVFFSTAVNFINNDYSTATTLKLSVYDPTKPSTNSPYFTLINSDTDKDIQWLKEGDTIVKPKGLNINIRYNPFGTVGSVVFKLSDTLTRIESGAPYSLAGDASGNYYTWSQAKQGKHKLSAIPYSLASGKGTAGVPLVINFYIKETGVNTPPTVSAGDDKTLTLPTNSITITGSATDADGIKTLLWTKVSGPAATMANTSTLSLQLTNLVEGQYQFRLTATDTKGASASDDMLLNVIKAGQSVVSYTLINADTDGAIKTIVENETLDLAKFPKNLNLKINTDPLVVGSVKIEYDSGNRSESVAPYSLCGDAGGNFYNCTFTLGTHTLKATPYTGSNLSGAAGNALTLHFNVIRSTAKALDSDTAEVVITQNAFPVPSSEMVFFTIPDDVKGEIEIFIFNNKAEYVTTIKGNKDSLKWDTTKYSEGVYYGNYLVNKERKVFKLVVKREM